jgi:hypothetical protein
MGANGTAKPGTIHPLPIEPGIFEGFSGSMAGKPDHFQFPRPLQRQLHRRPDQIPIRDSFQTFQPAGSASAFSDRLPDRFPVMPYGGDKSNSRNDYRIVVHTARSMETIGEDALTLPNPGRRI